MRLEITELHQTLKTTMIYVTHDQVEAMTMADKIVVLQAGRIEQVGSPLDLYNHPANVFVAGFIGSPHMNLIEGADAAAMGAKTIGVRPEHLDISLQSGKWTSKVNVAERLGSDTFLHVTTEGIGQMTVRAGGDINVAHGDTICLTPQEGRIHRFGADGKAMA